MSERVLAADDPRAVAAVAAIRAGAVAALRALLRETPGLATVRLRRPSAGGGAETLTLLHVATDHPGHFPEGPATVAILVEAGAGVHARFAGPHVETPLHWAASSDDVAVLDALIDLGADLEAPGAVIAGGPPLADAVAFGQWRAARRLVERGARTELWQEAALGLMDRIAARFAAHPPPPEEVDDALWLACHGGQRESAEYLLARGGDPDRVGYDDLTPLAAAERSGAHELVRWMRARAAR